MNSAMASTSIDEIRGDWSNLKGTEYHLVYALWSLLCDGASQVLFYQGNDLLVHPAPPPILKQSDDELPAVPIQVIGEDKDLWVQLKATKQPWTPGLFLKDNLLTNFMFNALLSEQQGRAWSIQLITPAIIQPDIKKFIAQPELNTDLSSRLQQIITNIHQQWKGISTSSNTVERIELEKLALDILSQLAQTEPVSLRSLKAEIELELAYAYPDREAVRQLATSILGALLQDTAAGPSAARIYDIGWLNRAAGRQIKQRGPLDSDPIAACTESIIKALPQGWNSSCCIPRQQLENTLQQFLGSPKSLFILLGMSGTGKSWAVADWLTRILDNSIRLLIPGSDLDHWKTLDELVARQLRSPISADWRDEFFLTKLLASARVKVQNQLVIVIDDLKVPSGNIDVFHRDIARLVRYSKEKGIKLVVTCQKQVWEFYNLDADILKEDIFSSEIRSGEIKPVSGAKQSSTSNVSEESKTDNRLTDKSPYHSFILPDLTLEELENLLRRRLTPERAERALTLLRRSEFTILRNPFLLVLFLEKHIAFQSESGEIPAIPDINSLLDTRVDNSLINVATKLSCSYEDIQSAFNLLYESYTKKWNRTL